MNNYDDDALDRAIFALPLAEPPAGLRASILSSTIYAPAPAFAPWEVAGLGAILAMMAWLAITVISGGGHLFQESVQSIGFTLGRTLSDFSILWWLALGGATAVWMQFFTGTSSFARVPRKAQTRSNR